MTRTKFTPHIVIAIISERAGGALECLNFRFADGLPTRNPERFLNLCINCTSIY